MEVDVLIDLINFQIGPCWNEFAYRLENMPNRTYEASRGHFISFEPCLYLFLGIFVLFFARFLGMALLAGPDIFLLVSGIQIESVLGAENKISTFYQLDMSLGRSHWAQYLRII
jgi:hypothetical protein